MGSVAMLESLQVLQNSLRYRHHFILTETLRREQLGGKNRSGHQVDDRDARPHQRTRTLLISQSRKTERLRRRRISQVNHAVAKDQEPGKNVTRQRGQEEIDDDRPVRPRNAWPRLNDRPPEEKPGREEGGLLGRMPRSRLHPKRESRWNVPSHQHRSG